MRLLLLTLLLEIAGFAQIVTIAGSDTLSSSRTVINNNFSWLNANKDAIISFTAPLLRTTNTVACRVATGSVSGCLASADWTLFNAKESALTFSAPLVRTTNAIACATCVKSTSPGVGIAHFAGATQDVTSSPVSLTADVSGLLPTANMAASAKVRPCEIVIGDPGTASPVLANDNDTPAVCDNASGATMTITAVSCYADAGSPTVTPIITGGSGTSILSGALTCGTASYAAGTLSGTPTQTNGQTIDGNITVAGGTAKYIVIRVVRTL